MFLVMISDLAILQVKNFTSPIFTFMFPILHSFKYTLYDFLSSITVIFFRLRLVEACTTFFSCMCKYTS